MRVLKITNVYHTKLSGGLSLFLYMHKYLRVCINFNLSQILFFFSKPAKEVVTPVIANMVSCLSKE